MPYEIKNRFTGATIYTAAADTQRAAILEAAASRADLSRADLSRADLSRADLSRADLSRADLSRANLSRANLSGANLSEANLSEANLSGANLSGVKIGAYVVARKVAQLRRDDGYEFFGFALRDGGLLIRAGCQTRLVDDYRAHVAADYPGTPKAAETLAILDFIEKRAST
jgi:uncharacterized protein YjbI with pentapeptide repeats